MGKEEFKIDLDFDLSKYNYESEDKPSFTLDDILGISSDVKKGESDASAVSGVSADVLEKISVPEIHIPTEKIKSADSDLNFVYEDKVVQKEKATVIQKESAIEKPKTPEIVLSVDVDKELSIKEASASVEKPVAPSIVNTAAFDEIKAKDKTSENKKEQPEVKSEKQEKVKKEKDEVTEQKRQPEVVEECFDDEAREDVLYDLKRLQRKITAKAVIMFLLFLCGAYLSLCRISFLRFLLPTQLDPVANPFNYNVSLLALASLCFLLNISPLFDGLKKAFSARLTADGIAFCLGAACILYDVYFILNPEKFLPLMINFDIMFILMLLMNLMGKRLLVKHISANFEMISKDRLKSIVSGPYGVAIDNDVMIETGNGGDILYASKTRTVADYMKKAFAEQNVNRKTDVFYFVIFALMAVFGILMWLFKAMPLEKLVILLTAVCAICAPIFTTWTHTLSMFRLGKFLRSNRTMISGREGASALSDRGVLVVRDTDLLSSGDITLRAMNVRDDYDTNDVLSYLATLFARVGGPLNGFFDKMLDGDKALPDIRDIYYHEQLGYTFSSDKKLLTVGTDEFMRQCRIDCPINPAVSGSERIYVAFDGKLVGVFSLTYQLSQKTVNALRLLEDEGVSVAILTTDFNLHETMFNGVVYDPDMITVLSNETAKNCMALCSDSESCPAEIVTYDDISGMAMGLAGCNKLLFYCEKHSVYRITASLFGILIIAILGYLLPTPSFWLPLQILAYQLIWSLPNFLRGVKTKI